MIWRSDFLAALLVALGAHGALLTLAPSFGGGGAGDGGSAKISLQPASAAIRAEVAKWETPPELTTDTAALAAPETPARNNTLSPQVEIVPRSPDVSALPHIARSEAPEVPLAALEIPVAPALGVTPARPAAERSQTSSPRTDAPKMPDALERPAPVATPEPLPDFAPKVADRPPVRPDRAPAVKRVASGTGGTAKAGSATTPAAAGATAADKTRAQARWAATIQARIARQQRYPSGTRASGRVRVQMTVLASGALGKVGLLASSGEAALDRAAILAVQRAAPFPPAPKELSEDWYAVTQWIAFERR